MEAAGVGNPFEQHRFGCRHPDLAAAFKPVEQGSAAGRVEMGGDFVEQQDRRCAAKVGDELSICVLLNPRNSDVQPEWYHGLNTADAMAHGWVERRLGAWIQDGGEAFHCKRDLKPRLVDLIIEPAGYSDQGSFIL